MIIKAPAKLNLEFEILSKREDGYHEIRTVMQTIDICDYLTINKSEGFSLTGVLVAPAHETTIYKAVKVLEETFQRPFPISVHLDKTIPVMAGMAASVGADVPFFIEGGRCRCEGFGEKVTPLPDEEEPGYYIIFRPHQRIATRQAYMDYDRVGQSFAEAARVKAPQLDQFFEIFPDAVVSGKGPTAFVFRSLKSQPELPAAVIDMVRGWDGDTYIARPLGRE